MKNQRFQYFFVFLMAVVLTGLLFVPAAASSSAVITDSASVTAWNNWVIAGKLPVVSDSTVKTWFWQNQDALISYAGAVGCESYDVLSRKVCTMEARAKNVFQHASDFVASALFPMLATPEFIIQYDDALGVYRPYDRLCGIWLVNSKGHFPYYKPDSPGVSGGDTPAQEQGTWLPQNEVNLNVVHLVNAETLQDYADHYGGVVATFSEYLFCRKMENGRSLLLVDGQNRPYAVIRQPSSTASGTANNYYTQVDNTINNDNSTVIGPTTNDNSTVFNGGDTINNNIVNIEDNSVWFPVDITDNSVWYPNSSWQFIDNLYYDDSTHTYYVDSHDSYVWSNQANTYITNNYRYEIQYHIDYTSITYIGQTAEYQEEYKFYYEAP